MLNAKGRTMRKTGRCHPVSASKVLHFSGGFTLVEVIVVISLISIMLIFSIPRFHGAVPADHTKKASRWIIVTVRSLKERSVREQKLYVLNVNLDDNRLWVTNETMSAEELESAEQKGLTLPDDVNVLDVEYPGKGTVSFGRTDICFYKKGYSDKALIHIEDNDNNQRSFLIDTFLSKVAFYERYAGFEDLENDRTGS
jgi:prepilin-type N-terminal cleavage/methylation domain-containing protein